MLRILRDDADAHTATLVLEGRLVAEWVELLEYECLSLIVSGLGVALDLSGVVFIGRSGVAALGRLDKVGVQITGCSPLIAAMLEQEGIVPRGLRNVVERSEEAPRHTRGRDRVAGRRSAYPDRSGAKAAPAALSRPPRGEPANAPNTVTSKSQRNRNRS